MAEYKVAQDVEAEDKLLGPFSFRQFIYLIIVAISIALAWGLGQIFIGLAIIPLPVILFFGALALPLRKDQPMEIYMAAIVSFLLKPHKRVWSPDGIDSLIEITAPKTVEEQLTKDLSQAEAEKRLLYLANIADTGGWSIRHTTQPAPMPNSSMNPDQYYAAQQTVDALDDDGSVARNFDAMISHADQTRRQQIMYSMRQPHSPETAPQDYYQPEPTAPYYNPYPTIHQSVVQPINSSDRTIEPHRPQRSPEPQQSHNNHHTSGTGANSLPPDIIDLANNSSLSVETIQREADQEESRGKGRR